MDVTRRYRSTVPDAATLSAVGSAPSATAENVTNVDHAESFGESSILSVGVPEAMSVTWRYAVTPDEVWDVSSFEAEELALA